ncbi:hypothetical protein [Streptomyces filamentosus]|uniref:hypothetical protein n=1 Tax=Streptomyces filamentosus TaxID=67294 RepID=UPI001239475B|nr:hypothetical protein [Streptomyces filamentosus]KAA6211029.1 hypothetical protein CP979_31630 [Streptomyces filamentosus]
MNVITTITGTTARVTPYGEIDFDALPSLHAAVDRLPPLVTLLLWDLGYTPFTDVAGLRLVFGHAPESSPHRRTAVTRLHDQPLHLLLLAADLFPAAYDISRLVPDTPAGLMGPRP